MHHAPAVPAQVEGERAAVEWREVDAERLVGQHEHLLALGVWPLGVQPLGVGGLDVHHQLQDLDHSPGDLEPGPDVLLHLGGDVPEGGLLVLHCLQHVHAVPDQGGHHADDGTVAVCLGARPAVETLDVRLDGDREVLDDAEVVQHLVQVRLQAGPGVGPGDALILAVFFYIF